MYAGAKIGMAARGVHNVLIGAGLCAIGLSGLRDTVGACAV
jgi:hypothetical protein